MIKPNPDQETHTTTYTMQPRPLTQFEMCRGDRAEETVGIKWANMSLRECCNSVTNKRTLIPDGSSVCKAKGYWPGIE